MTVPGAKAGLIIGPKGKNIRELTTMPGILKINFDTRNTRPDGSINLTIIGSTIEAVERVVKKVDSKLCFVKVMENYKSAGIFVTLFTWNGEVVENANIELVLHRDDDIRFTQFQSKSSQGFGIQALRPCEPLDKLNLEITPPPYFMQGYDDAVVEETFMTALKEEMSSSKEFTFGLGTQMFRHFGEPRAMISLPVRNGKLLLADMNQEDVRGYFNTFLTTSMVARMTKGLEDSGFECLNKDQPEAYTIVHLMAGPENLVASVVLALDKNLDSLPVEEDLRLSKDKEDAVKNILEAKTLGEVIPGDKLKVSFRKLSLKVHPDKNSHPGATNAMKKLNDAYSKLSNGAHNGSPALEIDTTNPSLTKAGKPPKVISVTTNKRKVCTVSMVTENRLNLRAYLKTYDKEKCGDHLSGRIRNVLNTCWENMDDEGGIADPDGRTGIRIKLVKQVLHKMYFAKEVVFNDKTEMLEVCIVKMRKKLHGENWTESVEIDINFGEVTEDATGKDLTARFKFVKHWWDNFQY